MSHTSMFLKKTSLITVLMLSSAVLSNNTEVKGVLAKHEANKSEIVINYHHNESHHEPFNDHEIKHLWEAFDKKRKLIEEAKQFYMTLHLS